MAPLTIPLSCIADTLAVADDIAEKCAPGDTLALVGDLGAGKTHFTKGLCASLSFKGEVTSPTFSLVQEYRGGRLPVFHFDFYRIEAADELIALGWDDYLDEGGVCIVEWADKFPELMPENTRWLRFSVREDGTRQLAIEE